MGRPLSDQYFALRAKHYSRLFFIGGSFFGPKTAVLCV